MRIGPQGARCMKEIRRRDVVYIWNGWSVLHQRPSGGHNDLTTDRSCKVITAVRLTKNTIIDGCLGQEGAPAWRLCTPTSGGGGGCLLFAVIGERIICNTESEGSTCGLMPDISMSPPRLLTMVWCTAILSKCTLKTDGVSIARPAYGVIFTEKVRCLTLPHFGPITCSFLMNDMNCCQLKWGKLMNLMECVECVK